MRRSPLVRQLECEEVISEKFFEILELGLTAGYSPADICRSVRSLAERFLGPSGLQDDTVKRLVIVLGDTRSYDAATADDHQSWRPTENVSVHGAGN